MSSRSYLSIGDVLTLLRQEFPDVTISKIRFLESQGLVNPERTPSGYRKFYEHDVDRLRWVLRQQREHFLPLKVIKDRLDGDGEGAVTHEPAPEAPGVPSSEEPVLVGRLATSESDVTARGGKGQGRPAAAQAGAVAQAGGAAHDGATAQVGGSTLPGIESGTAGSGATESGTAGSGATESGTAGSGAAGPGAAEPAPSAANGAPAGSGSRPSATHSAAEDAPHSGGGAVHRAPSGELPTTRAKGAKGVTGAAGAAGAAGAPSGRPPAAGAVTPTARSQAKSPGDAGAGHGPRSSQPGATAPTGAGPTGDPLGGGPVATRADDQGASGHAGSSKVSGSDVGIPAPPDAGLPDTAAASAPVGAARTKGRRSAGSSSSRTGAETPEPSGASMSIQELSDASGLTVAVLEELCDFGLLAGTKVAGQLYFDDEGLAVANLASGFAHFGVEPRHLRLYKNAADREAGFVEQIVIPLVRQRNPEARVRAHETVDELARLGQQLRASLLRSALGNLLDP
jgi:DNA-binding transcriptional MerR regulator